ncbi:SDR family oxidoreductase [Lachnospiraceae bacterium]|nr:SDR family oxidoreductase [Lachnospiraceae bacterium]
MKIAVTGATGFLGRALCRELTENGHEVTAIIRPESAEKAKDLEAEHLTALPLENLERLTGNYHVFFHLAWNGSAGEDRNDYYVQLKNLTYMEKALHAAKNCGCYKLIGAGSQAEYGVIHGKAQEAETVPAPFMMYGATKLACLHMGRILAEQLGITFVWPRIYSVYGPREKDTTLLGYVARVLREGEVPELSSCENMWDFMYITDFTKAMRILAENPDTEGIYHIASGKPDKLKYFVEQLRNAIKPGAELGFGIKQTAPNRTFWLEPDVSQLEALGFRCTTAFEKGICNSFLNTAGSEI